jgi:hypothetical protein
MLPEPRISSLLSTAGQLAQKLDQVAVWFNGTNLPLPTQSQFRLVCALAIPGSATTVGYPVSFVVSPSFATVFNGSVCSCQLPSISSLTDALPDALPSLTRFELQVYVVPSSVNLTQLSLSSNDGSNQVLSPTAALPGRLWKIFATPFDVVSSRTVLSFQPRVGSTLGNTSITLSGVDFVDPMYCRFTGLQSTTKYVRYFSCFYVVIFIELFLALFFN